MQVILKVLEGPHKGKVFTFTGHDTFLVGRSPRAHMQLPKDDRYVSRSHFLLEINPPECRLMDLNSRNGTYVNGQAVKTVDLKHEDQVKAGRTHFVFLVQDDAPGQVDPEQYEPELIPVAEKAPKEAPKEAPKPAPASPQPAKAQARKQVPKAPPPPPRKVKARTTAKPAPAPLPKKKQLGQTVSSDEFGLNEIPIELPRKPFCPACQAPVPADSKKVVIGGAVLYLCDGCGETARRHAQFLPGYQIIRRLGAGSMGEVYLALRAADGLVAAIKIIDPAVAGSQKQMQLFSREVEILQQLKHPNIVRFHETGKHQGQLFFVMDYVAGKDAQALVDEGGPMEISRAINLTCQLLAALHHAHSLGFVHRDIKPANMMVTQENGEEVVKLGDFGLARAYVASHISGLTMMGDLGGTVPFMAPEQILNYRDVQPSADQYSAAATLYTLLTGRYTHDFPDSIQEQLKMILDEEPVPIRKRRKAIPAAMADAIHRALSEDPEDRFEDVSDLRRALLAAL